MIMSRRKLIDGFTWTLAGHLTPLLAAAFAIPLLIRELGLDRFGILSLAWGMIGYVSLFDWGLGRALTHLVAQKIGAGKEDEIPELVCTAWTLMATLGGVAGLLFAVAIPSLTQNVLNIPTDLQLEAMHTFYLLAISVPLVIASIGLRGYLEARQQFRLVALVRIPLGVATFAVPVAVLPFSNSLVSVVGALILVRAAAAWVYYRVGVTTLPKRSSISVINPFVVLPLFRFGAWMTVSNLISPLMSYIDRFVIGSLVSLAAVGYYSTPFDMITKLLIISGSVSAVIFPAFSALFSCDSLRTHQIYRAASRALFCVMLPITLMLILFAHEGLTLWLGQDFAEHSTTVAQILAAGVLMNSCAAVPFSLIQAANRPDMTAKAHLVELPIYLALLWYLTYRFGIAGAAVAWSLRVTLDGAILHLLAGRLLAEASTRMVLSVLYALIAIVSCVVAAQPGLPVMLKLGAALCLVAGCMTWAVMVCRVNREERLISIGV